MATNRFTVDGYGQLELNNVAFRRDGRVEAQYALDSSDFASIPAENGMLLAVNGVAHTIDLPAADGTDLIALNYTSEHMYDERKPGLKNFKLERGTFLPRVGYLATGDKFTTNCFSYDTTDWADDTAIKAIVLTGTGAVTVYASESTDGSIMLKKGSKPSNKAVILQAIEVTTMPDGQFAFKFQVL